MGKTKAEVPVIAHNMSSVISNQKQRNVTFVMIYGIEY